MDEPGWVTFTSAAAEIARRFGGTYGHAQHRLRIAAAEGHVRAMKAPVEETPWRPNHVPTISIEPFEKWDRMLSTDWAEWRGADEVIIMINEDDFQRWIAGLAPRPRAVTLRKRDTAKEAIDALWPEGIPKGVVNKEIIQKVSNWLKTNGASLLGSDTILRAAGRKD